MLGQKSQTPNAQKSRVVSPPHLTTKELTLQISLLQLREVKALYFTFQENDVLLTGFVALPIKPSTNQQVESVGNFAHFLF